MSDRCITITDSSSPSEPRRGQKRDTASSTAVPVGARSRRLAVDCNTAVNSGCPYNTNNKKVIYTHQTNSQHSRGAVLTIYSPITSYNHAERARRHEASGLAGGHISASFNRVPHHKSETK